MPSLKRPPNRRRLLLPEKPIFRRRRTYRRLSIGDVAQEIHTIPARFKSTETSFELEVWTGHRFRIRGYCDDAILGTTYITKAPVCKLKITPTIQITETNIVWDISESISATGTVDTFDIDFGGPTDIGNLSSQDFTSDPKTGNVQYTAPGEYTITASVTDTLGTRSKECFVDVTAILNFVNLQRVYISTINDGVYVMEPGGIPIAHNTGLTGDSLIVHALKMHPAYKSLPPELQHIWIATDDGVAFSVDGAETWTPITNVEMGQSLLFVSRAIEFDPQDVNRVYVLREYSPTLKVLLTITDDYGETWSSVGVTIP